MSTQTSDGRTLPYCLYCCTGGFDHDTGELWCYGTDGEFLPFVREVPHPECLDAVDQMMSDPA